MCQINVILQIQLIDSADIFTDMIIYKITNLITDKVYIGQSIRTLKERISGYKSEIKKYKNGNKTAGRPIIYSMSEYGIENFLFFVIDKANSQKELDLKEKFWISNYSSYIRGIGYNLDTSRGGTGRRSTESKKKTSNSMLGEKNSFYGRKHTPETLIQMSNTRTGKFLSDNTKNKISIALAGDKSGNSKLENQQVIQLRKDRKTGATLKELSIKYNLSISRISDIVNNKTYILI